MFNKLHVLITCGLGLLILMSRSSQCSGPASIVLGRH